MSLFFWSKLLPVDYVGRVSVLRKVPNKGSSVLKVTVSAYSDALRGHGPSLRLDSLLLLAGSFAGG